MKSPARQIVLASIALLFLSAAVFAQPLPDPSLWNNVTNPSGLQAVPLVYYDPGTGILWLDNRGMDRVSNTTGGTSIGGDDVGTISLLLTGIEPVSTIEPFHNGTFDPTNGIAWSYQYFNGKAQLIGSTVTGQFIHPGVHPVFQYEPNLTGGCFGLVEMAVNFVAGAPGANLFGSLSYSGLPPTGPCIPEPAAMVLLPWFIVCLYGWRRRQL